MRKLSSAFSTRYDTNRAVQPKEMARDLNFWIEEIEGSYYLCSENKGADKLICALFFAYANSGFLMTRLI